LKEKLVMVAPTKHVKQLILATSAKVPNPPFEVYDVDMDSMLHHSLQITTLLKAT
jgi:hypothetical protein